MHPFLIYFIVNPSVQDTMEQRRHLSNLTAGTVTAIVSLSFGISYGVLIFSAPELRAHAGIGMHLALMTTCVSTLVVALGSSYKFSIAGPDSNSAAILALMATEIAHELSRKNVPSDDIAILVFVVLAATSVLSGGVTFFIGVFRRGSFIRFIPYSVVGGFLAGTGYLILAGAFRVLSGTPLSLKTLHLLAQIPPVSLLCAAGVAAALIGIPFFIKHFLVMPVVIIAGIAAFFLGINFSGMDVEGARASGLLFAPSSSSSSSSSSLSVFTHIGAMPWDMLFGQWHNVFIMTAVMIITILLNATGLDLEAETDIDFDRELRVNGIASVLSGALGGIVGYLSISRSVLNQKAGASSRFAGAASAVLCFITFFFFASAVYYFPRPVLAGLLIFLGFSMMREWVWDAYFKLPLMEYAAILLILALIMVKGLMGGVAFGLLLACGFFVYNYSRTSCVRHSFSASNHHANKERSMEELVTLKEKGKRARIFMLQGYIFFGTASVIVDTCRALVERENARYILFDFRMVQGMDVSAVLSFTKLDQICRRSGTHFLLSGFHKELNPFLRDLRALSKQELRVFSDLDHGLEWIEENLLAEDEKKSKKIAAAEQDSSPMERVLSKYFGEANMRILLEHCESQELEKGAYVFRAGETGDSLYFIENGEVSAMLKLGDGTALRLHSFGAGSIVGEMGLYQKNPRSADVTADDTCRVRRLTAEKLSVLEKTHPDVAAQFHRFVIEHLSLRLAAANEEIQILL